MKIEFNSENEVIDFISENKVVDDIIHVVNSEEILGDLIVETKEGKLFKVHYTYLKDVKEYCYQWLNGVYEVEKVKVERYEYVEVD